MKQALLALCFVAALTGCETMNAARYAVSVDNNQALKTHEGSAAKLASMTLVADYNPTCRLVGPIAVVDDLTIDQFVLKAINDELKFADIYSETGTALTGSLTKAEFSSSAGLTNGWWDLEVKLDSSNGTSLTAGNKYEFKSGFNGMTACNHTAQALGPAVQDLINKVVMHPSFGDLIR